MKLGINNIPVFKVVIPLILGIYLSSFFVYDDEHLFSFVIFLITYLLTSIVILPKKSLLKSIYLILCFILLGMLHMHFSSPLTKANHFSHFHSAKFLKVNVIDLKQLDHSQRAICQVTHTGISLDSLFKSSGKIMVYLKPQANNAVVLGSSIITRNKYFVEKKNTNPHVFDYKRYLNYRGIYHRMHLDSSEYIVLEERTQSISGFASRIRDKCISVFEKHLGTTNALAVASAMVLGERNLLTDELYDAFTDTGAVHVLAVSGLHVGIVSGLIFFLLRPIQSQRRISKLTELILSLCGVWCFALLTGAAAAVVRAAIMFSLFFVGKAFDRRTNAYNILSVAALLMLLYDPNYLAQAGFQFSFLALTGIIFFYPHLQGLIVSKSRIIRWTWEMISVSISAQILVSPLAIFYFHKLPTYFWFTGLIAIPAAFVILALGLMLLFSDFVFNAGNLVTKLVAWCFEESVTWFNSAIFNIQKLPFCSADDLWLSTTSLVLIYLALLLFALFLRSKDFKFLLFSLICLLFQSIGHNLENQNKRSENKLVVYDIYDESMIDLFYSGYSKEIHNGLTNRSKVDYITKNNRLAQRLVAVHDTLRLESKDKFIMINESLFLLYPTEESLEYKSNLPLELVVLSKNSYRNISKLADRFEIKLLVLDGTLGKEKYSIEKIASSYDIPIHNTSKHGALEFVI